MCGSVASADPTGSWSEHCLVGGTQRMVTLTRVPGPHRKMDPRIKPPERLPPAAPPLPSPPRLLTCVRAVVDLQILQAREALAAGRAAVRLLIGVCADVDEHLVPAPGRPQGSSTPLAGHPSPPPTPAQHPLAPPHLALKPRPWRAQPSQWQQYPASFSGLTW